MEHKGEPRRDRRRLAEYHNILCIVLIIYSLAGIILIVSIIFDHDRSVIKDYTKNNSKTTENISVEETTIINKNQAEIPLNINNISNICSFPGCILEVSRILKAIDTTKNPCQDFYSFSCGNIQNNNNEKDKVWSKLLAQIQNIQEDNADFLRKYKKYFQSCLNHEKNLDYGLKYENVKDYAREMKILGDTKLDMDIESILAILLSIKSMYIMDIDKAIHKETGKFILKLHLPRNYETDGVYTNLWRNKKKCVNQKLYKINKSHLNYTEIHEIYQNCFKNSTMFLDDFNNFVPSSSELNKQQINRILEIYPNLEEISENIVNLKSIIITVGALKTNRVINWNKLFINLFGKALDDTELIEIYFENYFIKLFQEIELANSTNLKELFSYVFLNIFNYKYANPIKLKDVETHCLKSTVSSFTDIASYLYFQNSTVEFRKTIDLLTNIFEKFKMSFRETFNSSLYRGYLGKSSSDEIEKIDLVFDSEDNEATVEELTKKYLNLEIGENFLRNDVSVGRFRMKNLLKSQKIFGNLINSFDTYPTGLYQTNKIYIPKRFLERINKSLPSFLLLPKIYFYLGKALAKFFDPVGIKNFLTYDQQGSYLRTFGRTYLDIFTQFPDINEDLSKNELVIENAATRLITDYYKISNETFISNKTKILFVALAQEYCEKLEPVDFMLKLYESDQIPGELRVNNIVGNSQDFDKTFECRTDNSVEKEYYQFPHFLYELL